MLTKSVATAMSVQLDRVNRAAALDSVADLHAQIETLKRENTELRLLLASYEDSFVGTPHEASARQGASAAHIYNNRPVIDLATAAGCAGVSVATAWRYCESGRWSAVRQHNRRWLVYADQSLTRLLRKK